VDNILSGEARPRYSDSAFRTVHEEFRKVELATSFPSVMGNKLKYLSWTEICQTRNRFTFH